MTRPVLAPLHVERAGPPSAPAVLFIHPNPMDGSCWEYQMAHLSSRFRTAAVDLPGYGRSPAWRAPFGLDDVAAACWSLLDDEEAEPAAIVGCSVGAHVAMRMVRQRPSGSRCLVLSGTGHHPPGRPKASPARRRVAFETEGLAYRRTYFREVFSEAFRDTPTARWFEERCIERGAGDLPTILALLDALARPDEEGLHDGLLLPVLVIGGGADSSHQRSAGLVALLADAETVTLEGAGHACHIEQPWEYDRHLLDFIDRRAGPF